MTSRSPDSETFSTPPTTPGYSALMQDASIRPSLSRRSSRPSSLQLEHQGWNPDVVVEAASPLQSKKPQNGIPISRDQTATPTSSTSSAALPGIPSISPAPMASINGHHQRPLDSPCFVHSQLDKGASLTDWLRNRQSNAVLNDNSIEVGVSRSLQDSSPTSDLSSGSLMSSLDDDDGFGGNLTKQLAETAVGVREMSKQLGP